MKGIVYKVSELQNVLLCICWREKRSWKFRGAKHKPGTNDNWWEYWLRGKTACRPKPLPTTFTQIMRTLWKQAWKPRTKGFFQESFHSFLDKNSVDERAPFPRVYASLVSSLRSNEQWRLFLYMYIPWLAEYICLKEASEGGWKFSFCFNPSF